MLAALSHRSWVACTDSLLPLGFFQNGGTRPTSVGGIEEKGILDISQKDYSNRNLGFLFAAQKRLGLEVVVRSFSHHYRSAMPRKVSPKEHA